MVSMRYARNLAAGHGLTWNLGQPPVEGYSNFLWTLWMTAIHRLGLPDRLAALPVLLTGAVLLAADVVVVRAIAKRMRPESPMVATIAAWTTAVYYPLIFWTLRGMEVGLVALLLSSAVLAVLSSAGEDPGRGRGLGAAGCLLAAAVLTRDDALVPVVVVVAFAVAMADRRGRALALTGGPVALVGAAHLVFRLAYYGLPFPNTFYLKVGGVPLREQVARGSVGLIHVGLAHLVVPGVLAVVYLVVRRRRAGAATWLLVAVVASEAAYSVFVGGDAWEWMQYSDRYLASVMPLLLVLAALGVDALLADPVLVGRRAVTAGAAVVLAGVTVAATVLPTERIQLPRPAGGDVLEPLAVTVAAGLALILVGLALRGGWERPASRRRVAAITVVIASAAAVNGMPYLRWARHNAYIRDDDVAWARYGDSLRAATPPGASIAVSSAGNIPYFSRRPAVDLLGKSDHVIASGRPVPGPFLPGHNKRDLDWSVGHLRPAVVAELYGATPADYAKLEQWGYVRIGTLWYRPGPDLSPDALAGAAALAH